MSRDTLESLGKCFRVTVRASRADLRTAPHGIPCGVRPLDMGNLCHRVRVPPSSIPLIYLLQIFRLLRTLYLVSEQKKGDKIRIKCGRFTGERGILMRPHSGKWIVSLTEKDLTLLVSTEEVTNY